jgi:hypothetical protein
MITKAACQVARGKRYVGSGVGQGRVSGVVVDSVKYNLLCASTSKAVMS